MTRAPLWFAITLVAVATLRAPASAETIVPTASLFSDHAARRVGDAITIMIVESTQAAKSTQTRTRSEANHDVAAAGKLSFFDFWNLDADNSSLGEGTTTRRGDLQARITARVTEIDESGLLVVEGTRSVLVNGEEEQIVLRGSVRPQDVQADNTVFSTFLADASIEYKGEGVLATADRPGMVTRIMNWLF